MSDEEKNAAFTKALEAIMRGYEASKTMPKIAEPVITEPTPGHIVITCSHSNLPLERTNTYGTFCNANDCLCEKQSKEIAKAMGGFFPGHVDDEA